MKVILSGGGAPEAVSAIDRFFLELVGNGKILFIPIAKTSRTPMECFSWIMKSFSTLGFSPDMTIVEDLSKVNQEFVMSFDAIYLGAGETYHLLKEIKKCKFNHILTKFIQSDKIVYGVSAGAIIFSHDCQYAKNIGDTLMPGFTDFASIPIIKNTYFWPHYHGGYDGEIFDITSGSEKKIIGLAEGAGVFLHNGSIRVLSQNISIFEKESKSIIELGEETDF